jgi:hypothetical protein
MPDSYTLSNTSPLLYLHLINQTVGVVVKAKQSRAVASQCQVRVHTH